MEKPSSAPELYSRKSSAHSDARRQYEAPRVMIKRSVANAILATVPNATGPSGSMLTSSG